MQRYMSGFSASCTICAQKPNIYRCIHAPTVTGLVIMRRCRFLLGQCAVGSLRGTPFTSVNLHTAGSCGRIPDKQLNCRTSCQHWLYSSHCLPKTKTMGAEYRKVKDNCDTLVLLDNSIDKLYTQIGNVNRLHNIIEPFAALF